MSEIWNLNALCRCCHADGVFKSLREPFIVNNVAEIYEVMLRDTLGVNIQPPSYDASYTICDTCIRRLRDAFEFKKQVMGCETKFEEYCKNEQSFRECPDNVKIEIDLEAITNDQHEYNEKDDLSQHDDNEYDVDIKTPVDTIKQEVTSNFIDIKIDTSGGKDEAPVKNNKKLKIKKARYRIIPNWVYDKSLEIQVQTDENTLFYCKECGVMYEEQKKLKQHILNTHSPRYQCDYCPNVFSTTRQLNIHLRDHQDRPYKCDYCDKSFHMKTVLIAHINSHTRQNVHQCEICKKAFLYKCTYRKHLKWHNGTNKKVLCDICGWGFNDKANLRQHINSVHEKLRPFQCTVCKKTFTAKKHLVDHSRKHTGERPYSCEVCSQRFITLEVLKRHACVHGKDYICKICKERFDKVGMLRSHMRCHVGNKPHKCGICGKDFSSKYAMNRHVIAHSGVKRFVCDICNAKFTQKTQLNRHKAKHYAVPKNNEKEKCEVCKRNVPYHSIDNHMKSHFNKIYHCGFCDKSYSERNALNRHIQWVHYGVKRHTCDICDKKYTHLNNLQSHKLKVHNIPLETKEEVFEGLGET